MKSTIVTLLLLLTSAAAESATGPQWFDSELAAVVTAARQYNPRSIREDREFMGAILRRGERYTFTVGAGQAGRDRITVRVSVPAGSELVAFWHTHGAANHSNRYFSAVDTALAHAWQKRFYLADFTGLLKVFAPGARTLSRHRAQRLGLPSQDGYARGDVVSDEAGRPVKIATRTLPMG